MLHKHLNLLKPILPQLYLIGDYHVNTALLSCTCCYHMYMGKRCKHVIVLLKLERMGDDVYPTWILEIKPSIFSNQVCFAGDGDHQHKSLGQPGPAGRPAMMEPCPRHCGVNELLLDNIIDNINFDEDSNNDNNNFGATNHFNALDPNLEEQFEAVHPLATGCTGGLTKLPSSKGVASPRRTLSASNNSPSATRRSRLSLVASVLQALNAIPPRQTPSTPLSPWPSAPDPRDPQHPPQHLLQGIHGRKLQALEISQHWQHLKHGTPSHNLIHAAGCCGCPDKEEFCCNAGS